MFLPAPILVICLFFHACCYAGGKENVRCQKAISLVTVDHVHQSIMIMCLHLYNHDTE